MSENSMLSETQPVSFGARLATSQAFADLFRDGMVVIAVLVVPVPALFRRTPPV